MLACHVQDEENEDEGANDFHVGRGEGLPKLKGTRVDYCHIERGW